eukprot:CAMPEP_0113308428 /NCGR_PEP_ID=MMETSP0010_2-20120614/6873_1 /TAXON_ID=216773 ORGANISM="Corethron hystrix, Strain 308" /NCGR_SAMPLE_ID=MMETSP0010_2 /ASSEMBLY_ACC=CAM_ASM_000155 /LENGTH=66 /DNA_ID=CAMNT_0000163473 /DNA_START=590 /DNA_END=790 /DNA_ORIENTATION=+ /assembly_acc=CAM_ASM_000155
MAPEALHHVVALAGQPNSQDVAGGTALDGYRVGGEAFCRLRWKKEGMAEAVRAEGENRFRFVVGKF